jgi:hypothetical protein
VLKSIGRAKALFSKGRFVDGEDIEPKIPGLAIAAARLKDIG